MNPESGGPGRLTSLELIFASDRVPAVCRPHGCVPGTARATRRWAGSLRTSLDPDEPTYERAWRDEGSDET